MKIETQRFIDAFFGKMICRVLDLFHLLGGFLQHYEDRQENRDIPGNICIVLLSEMGSFTLTWPMIQKLKARYPDSGLFILTFEKNIEIVKLLRLVPENNIFTVNDRSLFQLMFGTIKTLLVLRKKEIKTVIDCELFSRISSIYSSLSGAKIRVGFHPHTQEGLFRGNHINRPVMYNPYLHIAHQFVNLAHAIESGHIPVSKRLVDDNDLQLPQYHVKIEEREQLFARIDATYSNLLKRQLILLNPGGGLLPIRAWPLEYYGTVASSLVKAGYSVAVTGLAADRYLAEEITGSCKSELINEGYGDFCIDMTGFTRNIGEFLTLLTFSSLLITNDGGPGHFASLTSTPAIVLFGPETPLLYGCLNPNGVNMHLNFACSSCLTAYNHRNSPCDGDNLCLKSILPAQVVEKAFELLPMLCHSGSI